MDVVLQQQIPSFQLAASRMFCFPTKSMHLWNPKVQQVLLPEEQLPALPVTVAVKSGTTSSAGLETWKRRIYNTIKQVRHPSKTLDYSGKFLFDARFDTYKNISHILDNVAGCVFFARQVLQEHLQQAIEIHVILDSRATQHRFAMEVYRLLGIPVITSDRDVYGNIITVSTHRLFSVKQPLFDFDFPGYDPELGFEKVFIPRRGNRSLINNDEVIAFLTAQGFRTCYFEDYSIAEQWSIARNAKTIVAVHGAAVSSLLFNRRGVQNPGDGVKVIELQSPGWINEGFRENINAVQGKWASVRGQLTPEFLYASDFSGKSPDSLKSPHKDPFKVDCQTIEMALDYLESNQTVKVESLSV